MGSGVSVDRYLKEVEFWRGARRGQEILRRPQNVSSSLYTIGSDMDIYLRQETSVFMEMTGWRRHRCMIERSMEQVGGIEKIPPTAGYVTQRLAKKAI